MGDMITDKKHGECDRDGKQQAKWLSTNIHLI